MSAAQQVYRADRRNAARKLHTLRDWRNRSRIRTQLSGKRSEEYVKSIASNGKPIMAVRTWKVFTYVMAA